MRNPKRRLEAVDSRPGSIPVKFQKPPTLAEQIARHMASHERYVAQSGRESPDEADDFDMPDEDEVESPHELVYDEPLNREITRYEQALLNAQRAHFDSVLAKKLEADKARKGVLEVAKRAAEKKYEDAMRKRSKKIESAQADEE